MTSTRQNAVRRFVGFVCLLTVAAAVLALLGWPPTRRLAGEGGVRAMLAGIAVSLTASILSGVPVWRVERRAAPSPPLAVLSSLAVRFVFALLAIAYVLLNRLVPGPPFVVWLGLSYVLLLPLDVRYALGGNRRQAAGDQPPEGAPSA